MALAVGGIGIGTSQFVMMGLQPNVARSFSKSIGSAGHLASPYALGVVIGAPRIPVIAGRWPRHRLLPALMGFFALGNVATALAPAYAALFAIRFVAWHPHGV